MHFIRILVRVQDVLVRSDGGSTEGVEDGLTDAPGIRATASKAFFFPPPEPIPPPIGGSMLRRSFPASGPSLLDENCCARGPATM